MQVGGYDQGREAWKVTVDGGRLTGWVPEALVRDDRTRPPHEDVYRWLNRHRAPIERALKDRAAGRPAAAPTTNCPLGRTEMPNPPLFRSASKDENNEKLARGMGNLAAVVWIVTSIVLFLTTETSPSLISISAAMWLILGTLGASALFGVPLYFLHQLIGESIAKVFGAAVLSSHANKWLALNAAVSMLLSTVLCIVATQFIFRLVFLGED